MLKELFAQFLKEKQYLKNVSLKTLKFYRECFRVYVHILKKDAATSIPTDQTLKNFVIGPGKQASNLRPSIAGEGDQFFTVLALREQVHPQAVFVSSP